MGLKSLAITLVGWAPIGAILAVADAVSAAIVTAIGTVINTGLLLLANALAAKNHKHLSSTQVYEVVEGQRSNDDNTVLLVKVKPKDRRSADA